MYAAGSNFGDNDFMAQLDEFRLDSGSYPTTKKLVFGVNLTF